jgi:hypothetical protein
MNPTEDMRAWFKDPNGYKKTLTDELKAINAGDEKAAKIATDTLIKYFNIAQLPVIRI